MTIFSSLANSAMRLGAQAVKAATDGLDRLANRQEFEAVVAATVLVACADGHIDAEERAAAITATAAHPALKSFSGVDVVKTFNEDCDILGQDRNLGIQILLEKVKAVTALEARARIIGVATTIANADGTFSDAEKIMVARIRGSAA